MGAPLEGRELMAGLEEFEKHLLRSGVIRLGDDRPHADLPPLVAERRDERELEAKPPGPAPQNGGEREAEAVPGSDFAAFDPEAPVALPAADERFLLKAERETSESAAFDEAGAAARDRGFRPWRLVTAAVVIFGLAGLGAGAMFWRDSVSRSGVSQSPALSESLSPPPQSDESVETAAKDDSAETLAATTAESAPPEAVQPAVEAAPPETAAPKPQEEASAASPAPTASELTDPTPIALSAPKVQTVPPAADALAPPEPRKPEAEPIALVEKPGSPADATARAVTAPPPPPAVIAAPALTPKAAAAKPRKPKPAVAAKPKPRQALEKPASPRRTTPDSPAEAEPIKPAAIQTAAPAPNSSAPESWGPVAYLKRAQQAVGSVAGTVKSWIGMDGSSRP